MSSPSSPRSTPDAPAEPGPVPGPDTTPGPDIITDPDTPTGSRRARAKAGAPRSLADALRAMPDDDLVGLLRARPDLGVPLPPELTSLAVRAASRASVQRALDGLDSPTLQVVEVLAVLEEPIAPSEVSRRWGAPAGRALDRLRGLALVWGGARSVFLVRTVRDVLGQHPAGLGPPLAEALGRRSPQRLAALVEDLGLPPAGDPQTALDRIAEHLGRPETVERLLEQAPEGVRTVLDRLTWGPPMGQVSQADRTIRKADATGPVDWLLAHGLLGVADPGHVLLPREVGLALRGGRIHRAPDVVPPSLDVRDRPVRLVTGTAAGAAAEAVRLVETLGELWGEAPPSMLRAGGLGVRELRRTAAALGTDDVTAARVVEVAHVCGLVADDGEADPSWAPTPAFDVWRSGTVGERWADLVAGWWISTRCPGMVGTRGTKEGVRNALGPDLDRAAAPEVRRWLLSRLAGATVTARPRGTGSGSVAGSRTGNGNAIGNGTGNAIGNGNGNAGRATGGESLAAVDGESLRALLDWTAPRRAGRGRDALVEWTLAEAAWLGVTGAGALAPHARPLLAEPDAPAGPNARAGTNAAARTGTPQARTDELSPDALEEAAALLDGALPEPVDHVLLQADLTAIAPGPLEPTLARTMSLVAEVESRGGATVYRFTPGSVRRALDAGLTGDDLLADLARHSRTEVPQPLSYLIQDTARRHGRIRVGTAQSYLRADDEGMLAELLADRRTGTLRLRRLAPTVLAAQAAPQTVLEVLRSIGLAPAAETADGDVLLRRPTECRTPPRTPPRPVSPLPPAPPDAALHSAVQALRAADVASAERARTDAAVLREVGPAPALPAMDPGGILALLRDAVATRRSLWIGFVDSAGRQSRRLVEPISVEAGRISAYDRVDRQLRTFSVHRVTGVAAANGQPGTSGAGSTPRSGPE